MYYLDHAAATPVSQAVMTAMMPYFSERFFNPSSPYAPALDVRHDYEAAKAIIAATFGAKADELTMTAGATESINLAFGSVRGHVVTANIEHHAVLAAAERAEDATVVAADKRGVVSAEQVQKALRPDTQLVSIALANNELGTVQSLREIADVLQAERARRLSVGDTTPLYLHSDASQGAGQIDINVARLGVDMLTLNAGKVYGPKQVGLLWSGRHVRLQPQIVGGGQEKGIRSGTENVAGVVGFAEAMRLADRGRKGESDRMRALRDTMQRTLLEQFPDAVVSGYQKKRLPGHLHISFPGIDAERVVFALEMRGVLVATGSACAANKGTRSHVLTAIGLADDVADGSLRLTLGKLIDEHKAHRATEIIAEVIAAEYARTRRD